jgi:hypothetical protein
VSGKEVRASVGEGKEHLQARLEWKERTNKDGGAHKLTGKDLTDL